MNDYFKNIIKKATLAESFHEVGKIQDLWSGYGSIVRYGLKGSDFKSVVVKHVKLPDSANHPRGWDTERSHNRKLKSYRVEMAWYTHYASRPGDKCRVPRCLALETLNNEVLMVLEDLNEAGYPKRKSSIEWEQIKICLSWLAEFHAFFMREWPKKLWKTGTYWHLETRPDELIALKDISLKNAAKAIDMKLKSSPYQSFVHGDAKLANFCFSKNGSKVAAVDFQYVGGGIGMKDVAYFAGSCLYENDCERLESKILDYYFSVLKSALKRNKKDIDPDDVEKNWRNLYHTAWTDFHRFIKGWSPGHWKINSYSERIAKEVIGQLKRKKK